VALKSAEQISKNKDEVISEIDVSELFRIDNELWPSICEGTEYFLSSKADEKV
jgi:hypothetical protein